MFIIRLGFQIVNMKLEIFIKNFSMIYSYIYIQAGQPPATYKGVFIMHDFNFEMNQYLTYCRTQKRLDGKTLKAYRIDHYTVWCQPCGCFSFSLQHIRTFSRHIRILYCNSSRTNSTENCETKACLPQSLFPLPRLPRPHCLQSF